MFCDIFYSTTSCTLSLSELKFSIFGHFCLCFCFRVYGHSFHRNRTDTHVVWKAVETNEQYYDKKNFFSPKCLSFLQRETRDAYGLRQALLDLQFHFKIDSKNTTLSKSGQKCFENDHLTYFSTVLSSFPDTICLGPSSTIYTNEVWVKNLR